MKQWLQPYAPTWAPTPAERTIKQLIWLYIVLWLLEGALRKWILPQYSAPLLVIRDPVAVLIIMQAVGKSIWRFNAWTWALLLITGASACLSLAIGVPVTVIAFGVRTTLLHFPLIFIIERVLTREDVARLGRLFLDLSLPMALIMALQFVAGPDAFISKGVGTELGGQIDAGGGRIRAPGFFSFITGAVQFYGLIAAFLFSRMTWQRQWTKQAVLLPVVGLMLAVSISISRSLAAEVVMVAIVFALVGVRIGIPFRRMVTLGSLFLLIVVIINITPLIQDGHQALLDRWTSAGDGFLAFLERAFSSYTINGDTVRAAGAAGFGLGMGTNAAGYLLTGEQSFMLAEDEWIRVLLEMGAPLGLAFILWRVGLTLSALRYCMQSLKAKDPLALLLLACGANTLLIGQIAQPTTQGFVTIFLGLAFAACNYSNERMPAPVWGRPAVPSPQGRRGPEPRPAWNGGRSRNA